HHGFVIVGLPYSFREQMTLEEITGGSPYGASTIAGSGPPYKRMPTANELQLAKGLGKHLTTIARKLSS
ncbi:MAG: NAD(P)H:quinone oxidoreductase, partial [Candidatus Bathyarchaeota archaeon]|nr:NAD(P)H:quinone oxidoreductase [Candidatus Bathyarchaeota archaeon]